MFKKIGWAFFLLFAVIPSFSQTLFSYGNKEVSSETFLKAFNKNPGEGNRKAAMEEYLPLYINYVLKVQDAYDHKLDTTASQILELQGYKSQLAEGFIAERAGAESMIDESILRMQKDILLGHIYFAYKDGGIATAKKQAADALKELKAGKAWGDVAQKYSTDEEIKSAKGISGWISPFVIPYPYETLVYDLSKGGYTDAIAASEGVHIFSKQNERKSAGTVEVAQIFLSSFEGLNEQQTAQKQQLADSIYNLIQKGADFDLLVKQFSQDRITNNRNGILEPFGAGVYDPAFEKAAFGLSEPGSVSKPFKTTYGIHILKLIQKIPPPAKDNQEARRQIKQRLAQDNRLDEAQKAYIKKQLPAMKYKPGSFTLSQLQQFTDSILKNGSTDPSGIKSSQVIFGFEKQSFTMSDWIAFIRVQSMAGYLKPGEPINEFYQQFINSKAEEYLPNHLDEIDPDFAVQFKEFKDANLLFEAMEENVWGKANEDSIGLKKYFDGHASQYTWGKNFVGIMVTCSDSALASEVRKELIQNPSGWEAFNTKYEGRVYADSLRVEIENLTWNKNERFTPGNCTASLKNELDGSYSFSYILEEGKTGLQRSFDEARGYVVSDYQTVLENDWVEKLKKKYPVSINEAVWKKLLSSQ